jgi:hypothetical protein
MDEFTANFDSPTGLDCVNLDFEGNNINCFAVNSPLDASVKKLFGYEPEVYAEKLFKANWLITDNELKVLFANGLIHGKEQYTYDLIPDHPDEIAYTYPYSGDLLLDIKEEVIADDVKEMLNAENLLELVFEKGIAVGWVDKNAKLNRRRF